MPARRLMAAGVLAVIVFAFAALELRDPLVGFILGAAIVDATLLASTTDVDGRLPPIEDKLVPASSLGRGRLAGGAVGGGVIVGYAVWLGQSLASGVVALGLFWLLLLLSAEPRRVAATGNG